MWRDIAAEEYNFRMQHNHDTIGARYLILQNLTFIYVMLLTLIVFESW